MAHTMKYLDEHGVVHWVDSWFTRHEENWPYDERAHIHWVRCEDRVRCEGWYGSRDCLCGDTGLCYTCRFEHDSRGLPYMLETTPRPVTCLGCLSAKEPHER